ncbi:hypothetical protein ACK6S7_07835 [Proteus mirabilis]|uniref:hypothetical protein n=1 Tax=Proteus mirabilis TaxID=584 RepID=UPI001A313159|nr:hypothetical protein [Proteus mirabilis]
MSSLSFFLLIFNFPIPYIQSSAILALLLNISALLRLRYISIPINFYKLIIVYLLILSLTISITLFIGHDFSLSIAILKVIIFILISTIIINIYKNKKDISTIILNAFSIQAIVSILSIVSSDFYNLTSIFRTETTLTINTNSDGVRGNIIASDPFFLTGYLVPIALYILLENQEKFSKIKAIFYLLCLISIAFLSARTSIIGIIFTIFIFLMKNFKNILYSMIILLSLIIIGIIFQDNKLVSFVFELFYNIFQNNNATTKSSDVLLNMLSSFSLPNFFGEGRWLNADGSYFGHTDSGYMRTIYYYGIFSLIFYSLYFYLTYIIKKDYGIKFTLFFIFWSSICQIKGEIFIYPAYANSLLLILLLWKMKNEKA